MKKLILTLILLVFLTSLHAQKIEWTQDKVNHASAGFGIGALGNIWTYHFTERKLISFGVGLGLTYLAAHLKEDYDMRHGGFYNNQDIKATMIGGTIGTGIISIIYLPSVPRRKVPAEELWRLDHESTMVPIKDYRESDFILKKKKK